MDRVKLKWRDGEFFVTDHSPILPVESGPFYLTISSIVLKVDIRDGHVIVRQSEDELAISSNADNNNLSFSGVDEYHSSPSAATSSSSVQSGAHVDQPRSYGIERNGQITSSDEQTYETFVEFSENFDDVKPPPGSPDSSLIILSSTTVTQSSVSGQSVHSVTEYPVDPKPDEPQSTKADPMESTFSFNFDFNDDISESVPSTSNSNISDQSKTKRKEPTECQSKSKKDRPSTTLKKDKLDPNLDIIEKYLEEKKYHHTIKTAWAELWTITNQNPMNCLMFLNRSGLNLGQLCISAYPDKFFMADSISGVFYNISKVASLRPNLMTKEFLLYCLTPLEFLCGDEIRVDDYNFAGLFAQILSDEPESWTMVNPSRQRVQNALRKKIKTWSIHLPFEMKYKSLKPIFQLLQVDHTVECQLFAAWTLAYLIHKSPKKYAEMFARTSKSFESLNSMQEKCQDEDVRLLVHLSLTQINFIRQFQT